MSIRSQEKERSAQGRRPGPIICSESGLDESLGGIDDIGRGILSTGVLHDESNDLVGSLVVLAIIVDLNGNVLGDHPGMLHYTIGQRKGLGIALGRPMYVCQKNAATGDVVLCDDAQLYSQTLTAKAVNFVPFDTLTAPMRVEAKIRYAHTAAPATITLTEDDTVRVEFDQPQRAIARGQSVVFYDGDLLVGGGIIQ